MMPRISIFAVLAALAAAAGASAVTISPASARTGNARWCAVVNTGKGNVEESCYFRTIEACRPHVIAGNRGFCNENPGYIEPAVRYHRKKRHIKG